MGNILRCMRFPVNASITIRKKARNPENFNEKYKSSRELSARTDSSRFVYCNLDFEVVQYIYQKRKVSNGKKEHFLYENERSGTYEKNRKLYC